MMCGGWRQDKPKPYQLVAIRELVMTADPRDKTDVVHVGYWSDTCWYALTREKDDGRPLTFPFYGQGIVNIYGWQEISKMEPSV